MGQQGPGIRPGRLGHPSLIRAVDTVHPECRISSDRAGEAGCDGARQTDRQARRPGRLNEHLPPQ